MWIEITVCRKKNKTRLVTSLAEVWIEIALKQAQTQLDNVTSLAEVWIEIKVGDIIESNL